MEIQLQNFLEKVDKTDSCWNWTGCILQSGYGQMKWDGRLQYAHRISHQIYKGAIPSSLVIDHLCRNTKCVNPEHLESVTVLENTTRGKGTRILKIGGMCLKGHNLRVERDIIIWGKFRKCRICSNAYMRKYLKTHKKSI